MRRIAPIIVTSAVILTAIAVVCIPLRYYQYSFYELDQLWHLKCLPAASAVFCCYGELQEFAKPGNLFLLLNAIIFALFATSHLSQHPHGSSSSNKVQDKHRKKHLDLPAALMDYPMPPGVAPTPAQQMIGEFEGDSKYKQDSPEKDVNFLRRTHSIRRRQQEIKNPLGVQIKHPPSLSAIEASWKAFNLDNYSDTISPGGSAQKKLRYVHSSPPLTSNDHSQAADDNIKGRGVRDSVPIVRTPSASAISSARSGRSKNFKVHAGQPRNARIRREPSIGQEELNNRVESFISRFNHQIRLQRQESLVRYKEMVARSAS